MRRTTRHRSCCAAVLIIRWRTGILVSPANPCLRISRAQTASATIDTADRRTRRAVVPGGPDAVRQLHYIGSSGVTDNIVVLIFGSGANDTNDGFTPSFTSLFVNGANETKVIAFDAKTLGNVLRHHQLYRRRSRHGRSLVRRLDPQQRRRRFRTGNRGSSPVDIRHLTNNECRHQRPRHLNRYGYSSPGDGIRPRDAIEYCGARAASRDRRRCRSRMQCSTGYEQFY